MSSLARGARASAEGVVREWRVLEMERSDLFEVTTVEAELYDFPWTLGNFEDSLANAYSAWVARGNARSGVAQAGALLGYFLLMSAVDEAHLLNISVARSVQGRGLGRELLTKACDLTRELGHQSVLLEVRPSNERALQIYQRYGFRPIGVRRGYYPADHGDPGKREDALVYRYVL